MNKRYENHTPYDPGRFRYPVTFIQEDVSTDSDGSQHPVYSILLQTRAIRQAVTRRFNINGDITLVSGATLMHDYWYFIIRFVRSDFKPLKDMLLQTHDGIYTITAAPEIDEPPNYWKILCTKTDKAITT